MPIKRVSVLLIGLVMVLMAVDAQAFSITMDYAERGVSAPALAIAASVNDADSDSQSTTSLGSFNSSVDASAYASYSSPGGFLSLMAYAFAEASQDISITGDPANLSVSGDLAAYAETGITEGGAAFVEAESYIHLAFIVDGTAQFAFTQPNNVDGSGAYLTMENISTSEWVLDGTTLPWSGTIGAGSYLFKYWTDDLASMSGSNVHFSFVVGESTSTPVPEPATMLLLASGLVGLVGFRKRFKK